MPPDPGIWTFHTRVFRPSRPGCTTPKYPGVEGAKTRVCDPRTPGRLHVCHPPHLGQARVRWPFKVCFAALLEIVVGMREDGRQKNSETCEGSAESFYRAASYLALKSVKG